MKAWYESKLIWTGIIATVLGGLDGLAGTGLLGAGIKDAVLIGVGLLTIVWRSISAPEPIVLRKPPNA